MANLGSRQIYNISIKWLAAQGRVEEFYGCPMDREEYEHKEPKDHAQGEWAGADMEELEDIQGLLTARGAGPLSALVM